MRLLVALGSLVALPAVAQPVWLRASFHNHAASESAGDDGVETSEAMHRALAKHGFDYSMHSMHSTSNVDGDPSARFAAQRAKEAAYAIDGLLVGVGEELTVANGPNYAERTVFFGRSGPGNLNHVTLAGIKTFVPSRTPLVDACGRAHADGGLCLVNHPGPGPLMWEVGLWEAPANRGAIDGLEVYNGQAIATVGIDFAPRYLEATSYGGLGLKIAAVSGTDTHGAATVERARGHLKGASKLLGLAEPAPTTGRAELGAVTWVLADARTEAGVLAGVKARHTVATYDLPDVRFDDGGLGDVHATGKVDLRLSTTRPLAEVVLYREGVAVKTWHDASVMTWQETVTKPTAYVWQGHDKNGRFTTSATWYQPQSL